MPAAQKKVTIRCGQCAAEKQAVLTPAGRPRLASQWGWKRRGEVYVCRDCWRSTRRLITLVLPIRPQRADDWPTIREELRAVWLETTSLANWAIHQLARHDRHPPAARLRNASRQAADPL